MRFNINIRQLPFIHYGSRIGLPSIFGILFLIGLSACSPAKFPRSGSTTPETTKTAILMETGNLPTPPAATQRIPPWPLGQESESSRLELGENAVTTAFTDLAKHLNIQTDEVQLISSGEWISTPIDCELEEPGAISETLEQNEHVRLELGYQDTVFVYWVFRLDSNHYQAVACR